MKKFIFPIIVITIIASVFQNSLKAQQLRSFTKDVTFYLDELKKLGSDDRSINGDVKDKWDQTLVLYEKYWNSGSLSDERKIQLISISNGMLKNKMKAMPFFYLFLNAQIAFDEHNHTEKSKKAWLQSLVKILDSKKFRNYQEYLEITLSLINERCLYKSQSAAWYSSNDNFQFQVNDTSVSIDFPALTLTCRASDDSSQILNTGGVYFPIENEWIGKGGKVDWRRAQFDPNEVYALLNNYRMTLRFSRYKADSVTFYNSQYFNKPLLGTLEEKILADQSEERISYPQFVSYDKRLVIRNLFQDIDYEGGFSMQGNRLMGNGDKWDDAYLYFKKDGKPFVKTASKLYSIRKDRISSSQAAVIIMFEGDSLYHPGLELKYIHDKRELSLLRNNTGISESPFYDTYHKLDMYFESMYWKMNEAKIDFSMIKIPGRSGEALFESFNYFSDARYLKIQGIDDIHPLQRVKMVADKIGMENVTFKEISDMMRLDPDQIKVMMLKLANRGFLIYDGPNEQMSIKQKALDYLKAHVGKIDYDVIQFFSSIVSEPNATLSLLTFDMRIRGVPFVYLSDSQYVQIIPTNQEIILKKNRDFLFSGHVKAGRFDFFAKNCNFSYDQFKLNLPVIDSMSFYVRAFKPNEDNEYPLIKVKTVLQDLKGELLIDKPDNKSGRISYPEYPIFISKDDASVYYDKSSIQRGVYKRDKFYYHVNPFTIKQLDNFQTEKVVFDGYLVSANIFPNIVEPLKVQPDYSLGFIHNTPLTGLPAYKGKGKYFNIVDLSNLGLRGNGTLEYLGSTTVSDNFIFLPDSMNTIAKTFDLKEQIAVTEFPQVQASRVNIHWQPYQDSMIVAQTEAPISMFNKGSDLNGRLVLTPRQLTGAGKMVFDKAEMDANLFKFKQHEIDSDTANFRLRSYDLKDLALSTENYKSHIDFKKRKGEFKSNGGTSRVQFPVNQYMAYMDQLDWMMDKDEIALRNTKASKDQNLEKMGLKELLNVELPGADFVSTHPLQDSLKFRSPKAVYSLKDYVLAIEEVKLIRVADAAIAPNEGKVTILRQAEMQPLVKAQILADTANKMHYMYNAGVTVFGRKQYSGTATYDYIDETNTRYAIFFDKINAGADGMTRAHGFVADTSDFVLSPWFDFTGDVQLYANQKNLNFDGGVRIKHNCNESEKLWLRFNADIKPDSIFIPISENARDIKNRKLSSDILFSKGGQVYTAFVAPKNLYSDTALVSASGYLTYSKSAGEYRISTFEKLQDSSRADNYLSLSADACSAKGEGAVYLGTNLGQVKINTFGIVRNSLRDHSTDLDLSLAIDFFFNDESLNLMSKNFDANFNLNGLNVSDEKYLKSLQFMLPEKEAKKAINELSTYGSLRKLPEKLEHTFYLSDVKMKWDSITKSYLSQGEIGIAGIGKTQINKYCKGYIQMVKKRSGDILNIYLEPNEGEWYFFSYSNNLMQSISSEKEFNDFILQTKPEKRRIEAEKGVSPYAYYTSTERKKKDFLKKIEEAVGIPEDTGNEKEQTE